MQNEFCDNVCPRLFVTFLMKSQWSETSQFSDEKESCYSFKDGVERIFFFLAL